LDALFREQMMATHEIAKHYGVSAGTVTTWIKSYSLQRGTHRRINLPSEEIVRMYVDERRTLDEIAKKFGCCGVTVMHALHDLGVRFSRQEHEERKMSVRVLRRITDPKKQYRRVVRYGHPAANSAGKVYEHRAEAEAAIGRHLRDGEQVHHLNLDKHDNGPDNLMVLSLRDHARLHKYMERIGAYMVGLTAKRPDTLRFRDPVYCRGEWVHEIDLIGDREPSRPGLESSVGTSPKRDLVLVH
jgi:transposase